jgi:hypothetical protein
METLYLTCAALGGTLILCQFLLGLLGMGGDHDLSHDVGHDFSHAGGHDTAHDGEHDTHTGHGASWFFSWLTFRTVSAALAFFGLTGLSARRLGLEEEGPTLVLSLLAGFGALIAVGSLVRMLQRLNVDGTLRIDRTVGSQGTVYLSIPGNSTGAGKVHIRCQNRLLEFKAVTPHDGLATGAKIVVTRVVNGDTLEVAPTSDIERPAHV